MKPYCYIFGDPPGENTTGPDFFRMNHKHRVEPPQHCGNCKHFGLDYYRKQCCHPGITKFTNIGCCCNVSGYEVCDKWEAKKSCQ